MSSPLTPTQKKVLDFIVAYIKEHGYPPAYREISKHPGNAMRVIDELCARGYLRREGTHRRRNIILLFDPDGEPNWEGVANTLMIENKIMRDTLFNNGLPLPRKGVEY